MKKLLLSAWMTPLLSAVIYMAATVLFWKNPAHAAAVPKAAPDAKASGPSWTFVNPEADQLMAELNTEKQAVEKKQRDLNDLTTRLESERAELKLVTQSVRQLQVDFDQNVLRITEEETTNLHKLAKVYSDMDPISAAKIFKEMDDMSIIKIMVFMKDSETAAIWEAMAKNSLVEAKRAAQLSDHLRLASYRVPTK